MRMEEGKVEEETVEKVKEEEEAAVLQTPVETDLDLVVLGFRPTEVGGEEPIEEIMAAGPVDMPVVEEALLLEEVIMSSCSAAEDNNLWIKVKTCQRRSKERRKAPLDKAPWGTNKLAEAKGPVGPEVTCSCGPPSKSRVGPARRGWDQSEMAAASRRRTSP